MPESGRRYRYSDPDGTGRVVLVSVADSGLIASAFIIIGTRSAIFLLSHSCQKLVRCDDGCDTVMYEGGWHQPSGIGRCLVSFGISWISSGCPDASFRASVLLPENQFRAPDPVTCMSCCGSYCPALQARNSFSALSPPPSVTLKPPHAIQRLFSLSIIGCFRISHCFLIDWTHSIHDLLHRIHVFYSY